MKSISAVPVLALTAVLISVGGAAAADTEIRSVTRYQCTVEGGLGQSDTSLAISLHRVPDSLKPGEVLRLNGTLDLTFPSEVSTQSQAQLATEAGLKSTNFSIAATLGSQRLRIEPTTVAARPRPIESPFVVSASVEFEVLTVPPRASGELVLAMPTAAKTPNPLGEELEPVVFRAVLSQNSPVVAERKVGCSSIEDDPPGVITRIPIADGKQKNPTPDDPAPTNEDTAPTPAAPSDPAPAADPPAAPDPPAESAVPSSAAETGAAATDANATSPTLAPSSASVPPTTRRPGTLIPTWTLLVMMATVLSLALSYGVKRRMDLSLLTRKPGRGLGNS